MKRQSTRQKDNGLIPLLKTTEELILLCVVEEEIYGWIISKKLELSTGKKFSFGTLYPTLNRLEERGFLSSSLKVSIENKTEIPKKYYAITDKGKEALEKMDQYRMSIKKNVKSIKDRVGSLTPAMC